MYIQRLDLSPKQIQGACLHTPATTNYPHGRLVSRNEYDYISDQIKDKQRQARQQSNMASEKVGYLANDNRYA